jgi:hypothetical protein
MGTAIGNGEAYSGITPWPVGLGSRKNPLEDAQDTERSYAEDNLPPSPFGNSLTHLFQVAMASTPWIGRVPARQYSIQPRK